MQYCEYELVNGLYAKLSFHIEVNNTIDSFNFIKFILYWMYIQLIFRRI